MPKTPKEKPEKGKARPGRRRRRIRTALISLLLLVGGYFLLTLSARGDTDGVQEDFLGVPMYFSSYGPETNREMLLAAGFELVLDEIVTMQEPDVQSSFQWLLARRP